MDPSSASSSVCVTQNVQVVTPPGRKVIGDGADRLLARRAWRDEQHVIEVGRFLVGEVGEVATRLRGDPRRRLGPAVPLEKEEDVAGRREKATPPVGRDLSPISAPTVFLADPVVEADVAKASAGGSEVHEETVGLHVVDHLEAVVAGVPGTLDVRPGRLVQAGGKDAGPPPGDTENTDGSRCSWQVLDAAQRR